MTVKVCESPEAWDEDFYDEREHVIAIGSLRSQGMGVRPARRRYREGEE